MKAIVQEAYGPVDVMRLSEIEQPAPGPGEVLVRVRAAGVDPGIWHLATGPPYPVRRGFGLRRPRHRVPGGDLAGEVAAVGPGVTRFQPGDRVFGNCTGAFAEYACAKQDRFTTMPDGVTFTQAAAVAVSAVTALQTLRDVGQVRPGQRVLVLGAAGGVGTYTVQLAKHYGAHVTGVCSTAKTDLVRSLGADEVVDYTRTDVTATGQRYDLIVDTAGNRPVAHLRRILTPRGTLAIVGGVTESGVLGGMQRPLGMMARAPFARQRLRMVLALTKAADLEILRELLAAGHLTPVIDHTRPLGEAAEALRHLEQGRARGKVVLTV